MKQFAKNLSLSNRLYRLLLHLYPTPFRRTFGMEMAQVFRDDVRGTLQAGGWAAVIGLWLVTLFDLLKTAAAEHVWEVFHMPIEKFDRWTGPAAAVSGLILIAVTFFNSWMGASNLVVIVGLFIFLMWAMALFGLYRRLPVAARPGRQTALVVILFGLLLSVIGLIILPQTELGVQVIFAGYLAIALGIGGMGVIALKYRALGIWSFVPLLLAGAWVGDTVVFAQNFDFENPIQVALSLLTGISWMLLGVALWQTYREPTEPGLLA